MLIRVETNLKLKISAGDLNADVVATTLDRQSAPLMGADDADDTEVHYIRLEGKVADLDMSRLWTGWSQLKEYVDVQPHHKVSDWCITDFDDFLRGNPHSRTG